MNRDTQHYDVLVVGAGPVGLTLASELLRRGISCAIVDKQETPATSSRALGTHARTQEIFQAMGILDEVAAHAQPVHGFDIHERGEQLGSFDLPLQNLNTPITSSLFIGQAETERILRAHVQSLGGTIAWGIELCDFAQQPTGVVAQLKNTQGQDVQMEAAWLIGCDGGHSRVRKLLQLPFEGASDETWLVVDALVDWDLRKDAIHMLRSPEGVVMAFPFPEERKWRLLETALPTTFTESEVARILTAKIQRTLQRDDIFVHEPSWMSRFTIQQRMAPTMRVGRCFLAGDAAHVHSPASGQGLNTGIQDAYNLAWKLALVVQGSADESLLDTYNEEREPVAARLLRSALMSTRLVNPRNPLVKRAGPIVKRALQIEPLRQKLSLRIARGMTALTLSYPQSSIIQEEWQAGSARASAPLPFMRDKHTPGIAAGARVPDLAVESANADLHSQPQRLFEHIQQTKHTLLLFTGSAAADDMYRTMQSIITQIAEQYQPVISVALISPSRMAVQQIAGDTTLLLDPALTLHHTFGITSSGLYLVRPDGYVGYRNQPARPAHLFRYLKQFFAGTGMQVPASHEFFPAAKLHF